MYIDIWTAQPFACVSTIAFHIRGVSSPPPPPPPML